MGCTMGVELTIQLGKGARAERQRAYTASHYDKAVIENKVELLEQRGDQGVKITIGITCGYGGQERGGDRGYASTIGTLTRTRCLLLSLYHASMTSSFLSLVAVSSPS